MTDTLNAGRSRGKPAGADDANAQIASKLRALYLSVQEEAIPDRFLSLLEKLDAVEQQQTAQAALDRG
ncbi:NepR family anti-sigma factor [Pararhizobium sp.]|uniref:NepR family anti-sigma factor n=1 Tax=Pararhizobium sp. TaxID=1977563 RepID=UPI00271D0733|nr:NepR family anti-sigma factor [Pararhizobium sp.]MDO9414976.1 NepR family anti-sigma factor [Pararhizobium sp.]